MTEPMREALSTLRDHAPTLPSAKEAGEAVRAHLPNHLPDVHLPTIDTAAITERVRSGARGKWSIAALIVAGLLAAAGAAAIGFVRRHGAPTPSAAMYTPPLPKP